MTCWVCRRLIVLPALPRPTTGFTTTAEGACNRCGAEYTVRVTQRTTPKDPPAPIPEKG